MSVRAKRNVGKLVTRCQGGGNKKEGLVSRATGHMGWPIGYGANSNRVSHSLPKCFTFKVGNTQKYFCNCGPATSTFQAGSH